MTVKSDGGSETVGVPTRNGWIGESAPDRMKRMAGKMCDRPPVHRFVEVLDDRLQSMPSTSAPHEDSPEALVSERHENGFHDRVMDRFGQVDETGTESSVLRRRSEGQDGQDDGVDTVRIVGYIGGGNTEFLREPGIQAHGEMRALLLGASKWDERDRSADAS
jgi:hypothetical protein